jgi:hypothetical protein
MRPPGLREVERRDQEAMAAKKKAAKKAKKK